MNVKFADKLSKTVIYILTIGILVVLAFIIGYALIKGIPVISWDFLTSPPEDFLPGGGIGPELFNSFYMLVITLLISFPIAWGAAVYLAEYAKDNWLTRAVLTSIEVLSSLPSIVVGLFGFLFFVIKLKLGFSIISGAFALMIFNLPTLVRIIEQGLRGIDNSQREATLALGLTKWECVRKVLMPAALPSIISGFVLTAGRIFGEAAALIYTAGQSTTKLNYNIFDISQSDCAWNIFRPAETLAVHLWKVNSEGIVPDMEAISNGSAAVLIIAILIFNLLARGIGNLIYVRRTGKKN